MTVDYNQKPIRAVTDIVERLRLSYCGEVCLATEAADEIERLRKQIDKLLVEMQHD